MNEEKSFLAWFIKPLLSRTIGSFSTRAVAREPRAAPDVSGDREVAVVRRELNLELDGGGRRLVPLRRAEVAEALRRARADGDVADLLAELGVGLEESERRRAL